MEYYHFSSRPNDPPWFIARRSPLEQRLSNISEDGYCAGWMHGLEFSMWDIIFKGAERRYGGRRIYQEDIDEIKELAEQEGIWPWWPNWNKGSYPVAIPLRYFEELTNRKELW